MPRRMTKSTGDPSPGKSGPSSAALPTVALIGCGNWGSALALALDAAGVPLQEIVLRRGQLTRADAYCREIAVATGARLTTLASAALDADVLWICTPDTAIAGAAKQLTRALAHIPRRKPPMVFHSSGALASTELATLPTVGASIASVHPMMTFPKASTPRHDQSQRSLTGVPFAIEGDARACRTARQIVRALGGEAFAISAENKALYHAFGAFASPLLVAVLTAALETAIATGYTRKQGQRRMRPIVERTISNFFTNGPEKSFSGPVARGDTATIARHLNALRPHPRSQAVYRELVRFALDSLPAQNRHPIQKLLQRSR